MLCDRAIFTSCNWAYLDRALVLLASIREYEPESHAVLMLVEDRTSDPVLLDVLARFDEVIFAPELPIAHFRRWMFGHDVVEACTAVKGTALVELLNRYQRVIYLDPDTRLYSGLVRCWSLLDDASGVLTPHLLKPETTQLGIVDNELSALKHGTFNLGFIGVNAGPEGRALAQWWADRTRRYSIDAVAQGIFTDQKWMDLVPSYFPQVAVLRDPGYNVASWNLNTRSVSLGPGGTIMVNDAPLTFWHFTKARSEGPLATSRSGNVNVIVGALWRHYLAELANASNSLPDLPHWSYASFNSGEMIPTETRRAYRSDSGLRRAHPDPFKAARYLLSTEVQ